MNTDYSTFITNFAAYTDSVNPSQDEQYNSGSSTSSTDSDFNDKDNFPITASPENEITIFSNLCSETVNLKKTTKVKKTYPCPKCSKSFDRPSALVIHSYTHTSEKPFQCQSPGCGRRFSVVSNLRRHFKIHQKSSSDKKITSEDKCYYVCQLIEKKEKHLSLFQQQNSSNAYGMSYVTDNNMYASLSPITILGDNYYYNSQDIMEQANHHVENYASQSKQYRPVRPVPKPYNTTVIQSNVGSNHINRLHNKNYNSNHHYITQKDFNMKKPGLGTRNVTQASVGNQNLPISWFSHASNFTCLSGEYSGGQTSNVPESSLSLFGDFCFLFPELDHPRQQAGSNSF